MTRLKKELGKKIGMLEEQAQLEEAMGCGFIPAGALDSIYEEIWRLTEELARASHYESTEAMLNDSRWMDAQIREGKAEPFPFA